MLSGLGALSRTSEARTANQIYLNVFPARLRTAMSKDSPKFIPVERFVGLQVIESKASLVGNVKAVCLDFRNKNLAFRVKTKADKELDFPWEDVQSVEDVCF